MNKSELRKQYIERRRSLAPDDHTRLSNRIVDHLFAEIDFTALNVLHCYISVQHFGEVETGTVFSRVWKTYPSIITTAPRVDDESGEIHSLIYQSDTPTLPGGWKIPEPAGSEMIAPEAVDLVIVPLLCFDRRGHRVGYGKGFYDRFLNKCRPDCVKAGLSFFPPVESIDDVHDADIPLDLCITPSEIFRFTPTI